MGVKIKLPTILQLHVNNAKAAMVLGKTVGDCLGDLTDRFPSLKGRIFDDAGQIRNTLEIYINGVSAFPDELSRPVNEGDEIHILVVPAGG